jgi:hypothetical protein
MKIDISKLIVKINDKFILPKGTYYLSDPCYIYESKESEELERADFDKRIKKAEKTGNYGKNDADKSLDYWGDFCDKLFKGDSESGIMFEYDGIPFFVWGTAYGDGNYPVVRNGFCIGSCGVDAGLLSIFPEKLVDLLENQEEAKRLLENELIVKIEMIDDFEIDCNNGNAFF